MSELVLEKNINESVLKELTVNEWYEKLIEAIQEDLLSHEQIESLYENSWEFLNSWTGNPEFASTIQNSIIKSFFVSMAETKERVKNKQKVLADGALDTLEEKLGNTDEITAVEISQIFRNIKA